MTELSRLTPSQPSSRLSREDALALTGYGDLTALMTIASARRDSAHGNIVSYSPKVFIPLTKLCRDVCHYCVFAHPPRKGERAYMSLDEVLAIARAGKEAGCHEALFTLGDKPELRYRIAREELAAMGHVTTLSYLAEAAKAVFEETGLLPHLNPGVMDAADFAALRRVSLSQGIMLEGLSAALNKKGGPHYGSPDKQPTARLEAIAAAGEAGVPFTSGLLIGIGETREERVEALLALRDLQDRYGHIQEIIIQNFCPKPGTRMADRPAPSLDEHLWTIALARLIFEPDMNIQAPPNLQPGALRQLVAAGINDWGGVSPVTPDHVNPEAPWPQLKALRQATAAAGKHLIPRLPLYPRYVRGLRRWADTKMHRAVLCRTDAQGWPRQDEWFAGKDSPMPEEELTALARPLALRSEINPIIDKAVAGRALYENEIVRLFEARGGEFGVICAAADALRAQTNGPNVSFVITRNINYTNICFYRCQFCAFSKGKTAENLRGKPYIVPLDEIAETVREARRRGATEVCMQGGIHPAYTGQTYLDILHTVRSAVAEIHIHAFSPLEVHHGAETLGLSLDEFLAALKEAGLKSLPGTAAEILDDEVRAELCPDKIMTDRWLDIMRAAHRQGLSSTATIMFGHIERPEHWARHLLRIRGLQMETGGFTEMVPLPFVHMESPIFLKGRSRRGPTFREAILMHAICRLGLNPYIPNIQTSWVKMGPEGAGLCLTAGANDLGGTLMSESITRAAGASFGQEMTAERMAEIAGAHGRPVRQRNTLYGDVEVNAPIEDKPPRSAEALQAVATAHLEALI